jgi:hypothetical protein
MPNRLLSKGNILSPKFGIAMPPCRSALSSYADLTMTKQKRPDEDKPWSTMDLFDLRRAIEQGEPLEVTAAVLGRAIKDVQQKARELTLTENSDH